MTKSCHYISEIPDHDVKPQQTKETAGLLHILPSETTITIGVVKLESFNQDLQFFVLNDVQCPGSNNPEISLVRTKSAGTDFRNVNLLR